LEDLKGCLTYSAAKIPEISDNILNIDNAMRFGYGWQMGPFQMWDAIGVEAFVARAEKEGAQIAGWVKEMLEKGCNKFYTVIDNVPSYYCALDKKYLPVPYAKEIINLPLLKKQNKIIAGNADATLIDIGDGVACLELHSRGNTLSELCKPMLELAMNITEENDDWLGLVITSAGPNFCVGGDLGYLLSVSNNSTVNEAADALKTLQDTLMRMKYFSKPIVTALLT
jgi:3-hydroxyacyl-CoA dehydrogenase